MICPNLKRKEKFAPYMHIEWAHRGLHNKEQMIPENSMAAFRNAVDHNYGIELDVHLTKDTKIVVFHDDDLKRVCGVDGTIEKLTYEELRKYSLQGTYEKIPLLSEVLDYVDGRVPLLIEIKMQNRNTRVCKYLRQELAGYKGEYLIQSFNSLAIRWYKVNCPGILRGQLASNLTADDKSTPYVLRFIVKNLLANAFCKPDFISYKLKDSCNPSFWINQHIYRVPTAAWTLRTPEALEEAKKRFEMYIFEKNY
ncbi:glycerophosphodiester phosphodiesterase family protein [Hespellia stercorisuis]|nr:glycerophosphodiester phosphodiesterase family protein [Hespellia stercorisuis]